MHWDHLWGSMPSWPVAVPTQCCSGFSNDNNGNNNTNSNNSKNNNSNSSNNGNNSNYISFEAQILK